MPIIPLRKEADDRSEMVSQVLFGEYFTILETTDKWLYVQLQADSYTGWIDRKQATPVSQEDWDLFHHTETVRATRVINKIKAPDGDFYIPLGAVLPYLEGQNFRIATTTFYLQNPIQKITFSEADFNKVVLQFLNTPYLWGGKSVFGIDCSGFTQVVFSIFGISLLRDAKQQATQGVLVPFLEQAQTGDLAFFENTEGIITHVGIMLSQTDIIHAHGKVRIDTLDQQGIYNKEYQKYTHKLRMVKRYF